MKAHHKDEIQERFNRKSNVSKKTISKAYKSCKATFLYGWLEYIDMSFQIFMSSNKESAFLHHRVHENVCYSSLDLKRNKLKIYV